MKMRPLVIDDAIRARIKDIVIYAGTHFYRPGPDVPPPGDDEHFVLVTQFGYRAVFSFTQIDDVLLRHLSVSVLPVEKGNMPNPASFFALAELFGFPNIGNPFQPKKIDGLEIHLQDDDNCIVAIYPVDEDTGLFGEPLP